MNKTMKKSIVALACAAGVLLAGSASAQFAKNEDAVKYRQSAFTVMANHMGRLAAMARGQQPFDAAAAKRSAELVQAVSHLPWEAFVPGSSNDGARLKADPWARADDFKKLQERLVGETGKLVEASGSLDSLRTQVGATGAACKACHDEFRRI